jgi:hypothetical protein
VPDLHRFRHGGAYIATMTTQQLHLLFCLYLVILAAAAVLTRATPRRIVGALAGAAAAGVMALGIIGLGERVGWWHFAIPWEPYFLALGEIDFALCAFVFLITWRIARRFGGRGLVVAVFLAAVIGPPRDYWYMRTSRSWAPTRQELRPCWQSLARTSSWESWDTG